MLLIGEDEMVAGGANDGGAVTLGDEPPCSADWQRQRVLVVEDNQDTRELVVEFLRGRGFDVTEARSAESGLEALRNQRFEAVLTDYSLPDQTGVWMVSTARAAGLVRSDNVVLLTGYTRPEGAEGLRLLRKPYDLVSLQLEVEGACAATAHSAS